MAKFAVHGKKHGLNLAELGWGKLLALRAGPGWERKRAGPGAAGSPRSWPARSTHRGGERREAGDAGATGGSSGEVVEDRRGAKWGGSGQGPSDPDARTPFPASVKAIGVERSFTGGSCGGKERERGEREGGRREGRGRRGQRRLGRRRRSRSVAGAAHRRGGANRRAGGRPRGGALRGEALGRRRAGAGPRSVRCGPPTGLAGRGGAGAWGRHGDAKWLLLVGCGRLLG